MLPAGHRIGLVRADAGFCVTAFFTALEARELPYIIVARLTPLVRKLIIHRIPEGEWQPVTRGIAVADVMATLPAWRGQACWFVCLRQTLTERPAASGRRLIECPGYTYRVFVTTVPVAAELVTRMYAGRADCENRIKELKEDLSLDTFCLQSFDATDAAFRTGCVLYNLLMGFRETVLPSCWFERRLRAVRDLVFLVGADLIPDARRLRVRFAVPPEERPEFLQRLRTLSEGLPIAAQLEWDLNDANETTQPSVHVTNVPVPTVQPSPHTPRASPLSPSLLRNPGLEVQGPSSGLGSRPGSVSTVVVHGRASHARPIWRGGAGWRLTSRVRGLSSVAGNREFQNHGMMDHPIHGRRRGHGILEDLVPLAEDEITGDQHRPALIAFG